MTGVARNESSVGVGLGSAPTNAVLRPIQVTGVPRINLQAPPAPDDTWHDGTDAWCVISWARC